MMDAQVMFRMMIFSSKLLGNKQPSTMVSHIDANSCPMCPEPQQAQHSSFTVEFNET